MLFERDRTVVPKESAWFGSFEVSEGEEGDEASSVEELGVERGGGMDWEDVEEGITREVEANGATSPHAGETTQVTANVKTEERTIIPMRAQPLYLEDWIGLRELDERGAVELLSCEGEHMQLGRECWEPIVRAYVGEVV